MLYSHKYKMMRERCVDLECELSRYQATASAQQKHQVEQMREASTGYTPEEYATAKEFQT